ncbi:MAG: hotdog domain-containing protein [Planctomycetota bacterium]
MPTPANTMAPASSDSNPARKERGHLFPLDGIDLGGTLVDRAGIQDVIPHRGQMQLADAVVWESPDLQRSLGVWHVTEDEFWVPGHFPARAMLPGVLMVEGGAQQATYQWNRMQDKPQLAAFLRIENCAFRRSVSPGEDLYLLCEVVKQGRRRFITNIQGLARPAAAPLQAESLEIAFEAQITGMAVGDSTV